MKVSIIIPCYNVEDYIRTCIDSVLAQTYSDWELILVDDESSDNTTSIAKEYIEKDGRIKLISREHHGVSYARNVGIENATGEYVSFLDGDDYWGNKHLEEVVNAVMDKKYDMLIRNQHTNFTDDNKEIIKLFDLPDTEHSFGERIKVLFDIDNYLPAANCLTTYKLDFLRRNSICFSEEYIWSEDLDLFMQAISCEPEIIFLDGEFYYYRQDNYNSSTKVVTIDKYLNRINVYKKWFDYYSKGEKEYKNNILRKISWDIGGLIKIYDSIPQKDDSRSIARKELNKCAYIFGYNGFKNSLLYQLYIKHTALKIISMLNNSNNVVSVWI